MIYSCRSEAAEFFGLSEPERVIFTHNCTAALNTVIQGVLKRGDHAVISSLEHNAVVRPLEEMKKNGVEYSVAEVFEGDDEQTIRSFRSQFRKNTRLVVCTHASNVGCIDYLCTAGHKGLYGPMGTGLLLINCDTMPDSLIQGGTGSYSSDLSQPEQLPDKYESGTPNVAGIAGLREGVRFVRSRGVKSISEHEMRIAQMIYDRLQRTDGVQLYTMRPEISSHVPVISFNVCGMDSEHVAQLLNDRYGIAVRAGLHCAPLAHLSKGTEKRGTVRVVASAFNNMRQAEYFCQCVNKIVSYNEKKVAFDN